MLKLFIVSLLLLNPRHELNKDEKLLSEVVSYFENSAYKYNLDSDFLVYWVFRESTLDVKAKGKLGEIGYAQTHGKARKTCELAGYEVKTREGGVMCIGLLMDMGRRYCGGLERGIFWYATGKCNPTEKAKKKLRGRYKRGKKLWEKLKK